MREDGKIADAIAALRYVPALIRLMWQTHRGYTPAVIGLRMFRTFIPLAMLCVATLIIDTRAASRPRC